MTSTRYTDTIKFPLELVAGEHNIRPFRGNSTITDSVISPYNVSKNHKSFSSDQNKFFISLDKNFYHFLYDSVGLILKVNSLHPKTIFVLDVADLSDKEIIYREAFFKNLSAAGIAYEVFDSNLYDTISANNFYKTNYWSYAYTELPAEKIFKLFFNNLKNNDAPHRNVFLGRKHSLEKGFLEQYAGQGLSYDNDSRMDSYLVLEKYFKDLGYEIVYAENFATLEEQARYFYSVKTLVSVTGAGLANSIFMQPGQKVVELVTPMIVELPYFALGIQGPVDEETIIKKLNLSRQRNFAIVEELHHFYLLLSIQKGHTHISITNSSRSSKEIIEKLESSKILKSSEDL